MKEKGISKSKICTSLCFEGLSYDCMSENVIPDWTISFQLRQDKYMTGFALRDLSPLRLLLLGTSSMEAFLRDLAGFFCTVMTATANIPLAFKTIITSLSLAETGRKKLAGLCFLLFMIMPIFVFFFSWLCLLLLNEAKWLPVTIFKTSDQCRMT